MSVAARIDSFPVDDGLNLVRRHWSAGAPSRVVALVHGLGEHSERYDANARWLAARGYSVHALDQRGHGDSEGPRKHTPSFDVLLDDVERFLSVVRSEEPDLPFVLLGHSMGALVVSALLAWRQPRVDAAVLSGPALVPDANTGSLRLALARLVARLLPRLRIPTGIDPEHLSRDPDVVREYIRDPRINEPISVRLAAEILRAARIVRAKAADVTVPVMIVHGEADSLCRVEGSREFYAGLGVEGSELRTYPGLLHEILNEPEQEQILADIHAWLEERVALGRSA